MRHLKLATSFLLAVFFTFFAAAALAQNHCATDQIFQKQLAENPHLQTRHEQIGQQAYQFFSKKNEQPSSVHRQSSAVLTIPIVFHVVHENGAENIPDAQILAGIQQLNDAFANANFYNQNSGTNTQIQFCLARRTPDGQLSSGINRLENPLTEMYLETEEGKLKNLIYWETKDYVNIWLVREIKSYWYGDGVAGFATFPSAHGLDFDGIVMESRWMGSSPAENGVLVHEMGHYLGLYHTFQGGCKNDDCLADGDQVCDTPPDQSTLWTPCTAAPNTCSTDAQSGLPADLPDMTSNFMDYTDFECFHDFSAGQSERMNWHLENVRQSLLTSQGCSSPCPNPVAVTISASAATVAVGGSVSFFSNVQNASGLVWKINGKQFSTAPNPSLNFPAEGVFKITLIASPSNSTLCSSDSASLLVQVVCPVVADFSLSANQVEAGDPVSIQNLSQNFTQIEWFLNGNSSGANPPNLNFPVPGVHAIRLVVGNGFCERTKIEYLAVVDSIGDGCESPFIKTFGQPFVGEGGSNVVRAADGNFYLSGFVADRSFLMKMLPDATILWQREFDFAPNQPESINKLIEDSEGNLVGCGMYGNGALLGFSFKFNPKTDQLDWLQLASIQQQNPNWDIIEMVPGSNYLLSSSWHDSQPPGTFDDANLVEIARTDGSVVANSLLRNAYTFGSSEGILEVQVVGALLFTCGRYSFNFGFGSFRGGISCFDLAGNELWTRMPLYPETWDARIYAVDFVVENGTMTTLQYGNFDGSDVPWTNVVAVSQTDLAGNMIWSKRYSFPFGNTILAKTIVSISDGYVLMCSEQTGNADVVHLLKIDKQGNLVWAKIFNDWKILRGEKPMITDGKFLYLTTSTLAADVIFAKLDAATGTVGGTCMEGIEVPVQVSVIPNFSQAISLTKYPAPYSQTPAAAPVSLTNFDWKNRCLLPCGPEICNNGVDDNGNDLFDCLDPDCDCTACDGEQARIWYFGDRSGLDFRTEPPTQLADGQTFSYECSAVANDPHGNLLFYTDGATLFNRLHQPMPDGSNLNGHSSSTQTLILEKPGAKNLFYVFTPNSFDNLQTGKGLSYSVVDMSLDGGRGNVVAGQKNIELIDVQNFTEKITATRHCDGINWWVTAKLSQNNWYQTWLLTAGGLSGPNTQALGTQDEAVNGQMRFSPDGRLLANTTRDQSGIELFIFDNPNGVFYNHLFVPTPDQQGNYGLEFSPDGRLLYLTNLTPPCQIRQFDLTKKTAAEIAVSATTLATSDVLYHFGKLQLAPNGKIYTTNSTQLVFTQKLGVIHFPNRLGEHCFYQEEGQNLAGGGSNLGLPDFPLNLIDQKIHPKISGVDTICGAPQSVDFQLTGITCAVEKVEWQVVGGTVLNSSNTSLTANFAAAGKAKIIASVATKCTSASDTLDIEILTENPPTLNLGADFLICKNGVVELNAGAGFKKYRWHDGSTEQKLTAIAPGKFWVEVEDGCSGKQVDTIKIGVLPKTQLELGDDLKGCAGQKLKFNLPPDFKNWKWLPATGLDCSDCPAVTATISNSTTYIVIAQTVEGCVSADTIEIEVATDTIFVKIDTTICVGATVQFFGKTLPADTVATFNFSSGAGCDSSVVVSVFGIDPISVAVDAVICAGDTAVFAGQIFTRDTSVVFKFESAAGCDSTILYGLGVLPAPKSEQVLFACPPDGEVVFLGEKLQIGDERTFVLNVGQFCDSTVVVRVEPSPIVPKIIFPPPDTIFAGDSISLSPTVTGTAPIIYDWSPKPPPQFLSCYDCPDPIASPTQTTIFQLKITDAAGCMARDSVLVTVRGCSSPFVPNAFTPNGDGVNDWFYIFGPEECLREVLFLRIYGRWGELIFERENFDANVENLGWDGRFRGRAFPMDVLFWTARFGLGMGMSPCSGDAGFNFRLQNRRVVARQKIAMFARQFSSNQFFSNF